MKHLVQPLSPAYLQEIAAHFASLDLPYPRPEAASGTSEALRRGRQLVFDGDSSLRLPACVQCHGQAMTGMLPATPGLLGLSKDYLTAQLGAWRNGLRTAREPDCMKAISLRLKESDVHAVSAFLSSQALPRDTRARRREALESTTGDLQCAPPRVR